MTNMNSISVITGHKQEIIKQQSQAKSGIINAKKHDAKSLNQHRYLVSVD